jgi:DNA mismatch endonuclease, patch repair protein
VTGPKASSPGALRRMQRQRRRDTKAEVELRRELHRLGLRYRVDHQVLPTVRRRADIAFTRAKVAVFVDGCFWHRCPQHGTAPKSNSAWWAEKLAKNVQRDRDTDRRLAEAGWQVIHVWEHEVPHEAAARIAHAATAGPL